MAISFQAATRLIPGLFQLVRPTHLAVLWRDLTGLRHSIPSDEDHLRATMEWLCRAQDRSGGGGVSGAYALYGGWKPAYPETTGYIIPTFLEYASVGGGDDYSERAVRMGDWEIDVQLPSGAVRGGMGMNPNPIVFNTGQVILGWVALHRATKAARFLDAAKRAADWLVTCQDDDGKWNQHTYHETPHSYHTRVAWALFEASDATTDDRYRNAATKNIRWALTQAKDNGWSRQAAFRPGETPFTHTIAYTLRGLLESARFLDEELKTQALSVVTRATEHLLTKYELRKPDGDSTRSYLSGTFDENWTSTDNYSCLTGNAQIAIVWLKHYQMKNDARFLKAASRIIDQVKATQSLRSTNPGIRGAVAGSYPIWGAYARLRYPNWAAKFLADALMLQESITARLRK